MNKIGRNDTCNCGSGKKYKKCCINKIILDKFKLGQLESSEKIQNCINKLKKNHPFHKIINITDDLQDSNYREYQLKNFSDNIIMIAEKTVENAIVFLTRVNDFDSDIMVMYHGSYRTFKYKDLDSIIDSVSEMIK
jgi:hypothetical protein